jgi:protein-disulfide isomerase
MKKVITIAVILILTLGFGYFLFKISPKDQEQKTVVSEDFNLNGLKSISEPLPLAENDHILGNKDAKNTIVAYEDIQCPACANFSPILHSLPTELKDTKVVFRHFPLLTLHKNAAYAAFASEAANAQGKFWEFTTLMYENQVKWSEETDPTEQIVLLAKEAGVSNLEQFKSDLTAKKYKARVEENLREGMALNVNATPTLYFNNVKLTLGGLDALKKQVEKLYK